MYEIWQYFTIEEREAAAAHEYISLFADSTMPCPADKAGHCPLANALLQLPGITIPRCRPNHFSVINKLRDAERLQNDNDEAVTAVTESTRRFISDWDSGVITDLRTAMGLPPKKEEFTQ